MGVKKVDGSLSKTMPPEEQEILDEMDIKLKKYLRGESANVEGRIVPAKLAKILDGNEDVHIEHNHATRESLKVVLMELHI